MSLVTIPGDFMLFIVMEFEESFLCLNRTAMCGYMPVRHYVNIKLSFGAYDLISFALSSSNNEFIWNTSGGRRQSGYMIQPFGYFCLSRRN
jgi:hypothetical protein